MEFLKHKAGLIVLVVNLVITVVTIWYLMSSTPQGGGYESGTLVEGIKNPGVVRL